MSSGRFVTFSAIPLLAGAAIFAIRGTEDPYTVAAAVIMGVSGLALLGYAALDRKVTVRLSRETVQQRVDAELPIKGTAAGVDYEVTRAHVTLRPDARIEVDADVSATALGQSARANVVGSGVLVYRDGAFHLSAFRVERASAEAGDPTPEAGWSLAGLVGAASLVGQAGGMLEGTRLGGAAAFLGEKAGAAAGYVREKGGELLAGALERFPVHRLDGPDRKSRLAKLVLDDVRVEDGYLVATLDPAGLLR